MASESYLVFSKFFGTLAGGAEKSLALQLEEKATQGARVEILEVAGAYLKAPQAKRTSSWVWTRFPVRLFHAARFKFIEYAINRKRIRRFFSNREPGQTLVTYGYWAPAAVATYQGDSLLMIRDEFGLGYERNYYRGWRRVAKALYFALEYPFYRLWLHDLRGAIARAAMVQVNSEFIQTELARRFSRLENVTLRYPDIDNALLQNTRAALEAARIARPAQARPRVLFIGDSIIKGRDLIEKLARHRNDLQFELFDRAITQERVEANVRFRPWTANLNEIYGVADLVLIPSRCNEAFSRVAREAALLGLPVVASNRGGIPEALALPNSKHKLIDDIDDLNAWSEAIDSLLASKREPE